MMTRWVWLSLLKTPSATECLTFSHQSGSHLPPHNNITISHQTIKSNQGIDYYKNTSHQHLLLQWMTWDAAGIYPFFFPGNNISERYTISQCCVYRTQTGWIYLNVWMFWPLNGGDLLKFKPRAGKYKSIHAAAFDSTAVRHSVDKYICMITQATDSRVNRQFLIRPMLLTQMYVCIDMAGLLDCCIGLYRSTARCSIAAASNLRIEDIHNKCLC